MADDVCAGCGRPWPPGQTQCPNCGARRSSQINTMQTGQDVRLWKTAIQTVWQINRGWIIAFLLFEALAVAGSFWTSRWCSVAYSIITAVIATILGAKMLVKTVRVTKETDGRS